MLNNISNMYPEDIQNKIRNKLTPCLIINNIMKTIIKSYNTNDKEQLYNIIEYVNNLNISKIVEGCINDIIDISNECDKKINNSNFDVWQEVLKSRQTKNMSNVVSSCVEVNS